jgi:hypothetical protein
MCRQVPQTLFAPPLTHPDKIVPTCRPFDIIWQPTTPNTITLVLLRGPANNIIPFSPLVTGTANSGSYRWTPSAALQADTSGTLLVKTPRYTVGVVVA